MTKREFMEQLNHMAEEGMVSGMYDSTGSDIE